MQACSQPLQGWHGRMSDSTSVKLRRYGVLEGEQCQLQAFASRLRNGYCERQLMKRAGLRPQLLFTGNRLRE